MNNYSGYENYFNDNSNEKDENNNNFGLDSFDNNNPSDNITRSIASGKKNEEKISNIFNKNPSQFHQNDIISESKEFKTESNKIIQENKIDSNKKINQFVENQISQKTEKENEKISIKEKEDNLFDKQINISKSKRNSKNTFVSPPNISMITGLKIDYQKYDDRILTKIDKDYYEKIIEQLKSENEKLNEQYKKEFDKECEAVNNLKEQHRKDLEKIRNDTDKKIEELNKNRELIEKNLENEKKTTEDIIAKKIENIKQVNKEKEKLKQMELDNQMELMKLIQKEKN